MYLFKFGTLVFLAANKVNLKILPSIIDLFKLIIFVFILNNFLFFHKNAHAAVKSDAHIELPVVNIEQSKVAWLARDQGNEKWADLGDIKNIFVCRKIYENTRMGFFVNSDGLMDTKSVLNK